MITADNYYFRLGAKSRKIGAKSKGAEAGSATRRACCLPTWMAEMEAVAMHFV
jgi:hypothetical protein